MRADSDTVSTIGSCQERRILLSGVSMPCALCTAVFGTATGIVAMLLNPLPDRNFGRRSSGKMLNEIDETNENCYRQVGVWQSFGNARYGTNG